MSTSASSKTERPERIEQVIFKVGNGITICASFFASSGIDDLFDDAIKILCTELCMSRKELLEKIDLEKTREKVRLIAVKDMIRRSTETSGDAYEVVEYLSDSIAELKKLRESDETFQRNKNTRVQHAEFLANLMKYEEALKVFNRFRNDPDVAFRIFLCHLAMRNTTEAGTIVKSAEKKLETTGSSDLIDFMGNLYRNYIRKDLKSFVENLKKREEGSGIMLKDSFIVCMLLRIKNIISES